MKIENKLCKEVLELLKKSMLLFENIFIYTTKNFIYAYSDSQKAMRISLEEFRMLLDETNEVFSSPVFSNPSSKNKIGLDKGTVFWNHLFQDYPDTVKAVYDPYLRLGLNIESEVSAYFMGKYITVCYRGLKFVNKDRKVVLVKTDKINFARMLKRQVLVPDTSYVKYVQPKINKLYVTSANDCT